MLKINNEDKLAWQHMQTANALQVNAHAHAYGDSGFLTAKTWAGKSYTCTASLQCESAGVWSAWSCQQIHGNTFYSGMDALQYAYACEWSLKRTGQT